MQIQSLKYLYYKDDNFLFKFEKYEDVVFIHCECVKWSVSVLKQMYSVFNTFTNELKQNGMYKVLTITPNPKFAKLFNGETVGTLSHEGKEYEVIKWELKP